LYTYEYPRPAVTVDIIVFTFQNNELKVLLVQRKIDPFAGHWALPGGFVDMDEDLDAAALRELAEETNITDVYLEQLYTFGQPQRDPRGRVITVAYFALLSLDEATKQQVHAGDDAGDADWFNIYKLPKLAFDHQSILDYALQRLRLNKPLDKRNFRRKMLAAVTEDVAVLEETGEQRRGDHRPAKLYRFSAKAIELEQVRKRFP